MFMWMILEGTRENVVSLDLVHRLYICGTILAFALLLNHTIMCMSLYLCCWWMCSDHYVFIFIHFYYQTSTSFKSSQVLKLLIFEKTVFLLWNCLMSFTLNVVYFDSVKITMMIHRRLYLKVCRDLILLNSLRVWKH